VASGVGCPSCASYGFDPGARSLVYLLMLSDPPLLKIGITAEDGVRLDYHRRRGWETVRLWSTDAGVDALRLESGVLQWWRERGAAFCLPDEVPGRNGYTECVHVGRVDAPGTAAFVESLRSESI